MEKNKEKNNEGSKHFPRGNQHPPVGVNKFESKVNRSTSESCKFEENPQNFQVRVI